MEEPIKHEGIVASITGTTARVRIVQTSACSACHAKSMCTASETMAKEIDAQMMEPMAVGDHVMVEVARKLGHKAVILSFVIPLILMVATASISAHFITSEAITGTLTLAVLLPYFLLLKALDKKITKEYRFVARRIE